MLIGLRRLQSNLNVCHKIPDSVKHDSDCVIYGLTYRCLMQFTASTFTAAVGRCYTCLANCLGLYNTYGR